MASLHFFYREVSKTVSLCIHSRLTYFPVYHCVKWRSQLYTLSALCDFVVKFSMYIFAEQIINIQYTHKSFPSFKVVAKKLLCRSPLCL